MVFFTYLCQYIFVSGSKYIFWANFANIYFLGQRGIHTQGFEIIANLISWQSVYFQDYDIYIYDWIICKACEIILYTQFAAS